MSFFSGIPVAPPIEVFHRNKQYLDEKAPEKVNLTIGAYRTNEGVPMVLPVVKQAEIELANDSSLNHEYLPVLGHEGFRNAAMELVLGEDSPAIKEKRAFGIQCLSGTGSLRAGAEFLAGVVGLKTAYVSQPTWGNHKLVFKNAGFTAINTYTYWNAEKRCVNIDQLVDDLDNAPEKSVIILHGCAHNPTGMDPTQEQWKRIAQVIKKRNLFPFFDIAYQGFATGDPNADAWAVRYFVDQGLEMVVAQSFAKNFGLYNERVGNLTVVVNDKEVIPGFLSQMSLVIRANWSNPPAHGAQVVHLVLTNPDKRQQWMDSIKEMSGRIKTMREALRTKLEALGTPGTWNHITEQIGMFSFTGLTGAQVDHLIKAYKIFLLSDGRINICGLNTSNIDYVANAIDRTVRSI
ncbi:unnamed protein product [Caenorhabditis auriculariae]|uniref:Aspartate aminotransferase n=1 Tax=Caenorhabditis auriculariae TaxID=2777116 RepID=A0A8S1GQH3_9PELO|nr:unnamed protein product [Caenorhabditis auriculariae]